MIKKILLASFASIILIFTAQNAAASVKTSSLTFAKPTANSNLPSQCQKMFNVADKLVKEAERQPGTHTQVSKMKTKLSSTKQKILKMESVMQQKSCDKGLTALNTLQQKH